MGKRANNRSAASLAENTEGKSNTWVNGILSMEVSVVPRIIIEWFEGRTIDQKRQLASLISDAVVQVDRALKKDNVEVVYRDIAKANYARGGILQVDRK